MKIALLASQGVLAESIWRSLKTEGHQVHSVLWAAGSRHLDKKGFFGSEASRIQAMLRGAHALLYLGWQPSETDGLLLRTRSHLLPLRYFLSSAASAPGTIERLVIVSSAGLYGEGSYTCPVNGIVNPQWRREEDLRAGRWEHPCPVCHEQLLPVPAPEDHPPAPLSRSGALLAAQERLLTAWALERRIPVVSVRYFEIYGAHAVGAAEQLISHAVEGLPLEVTEDGRQTRDYISLEDVLRAASLALRAPCRDRLVLNVGSGVQTSTLQFLTCLERALRKPLETRCLGNFNRAEPRHLYAGTTELNRLGYHPPLSLQEGLERYLGSIREKTTKTSRG